MEINRLQHLRRFVSALLALSFFFSNLPAPVFADTLRVLQEKDSALLSEEFRKAGLEEPTKEEIDEAVLEATPLKDQTVDIGFLKMGPGRDYSDRSRLIDRLAEFRGKVYVADSVPWLAKLGVWVASEGTDLLKPGDVLIDRSRFQLLGPKDLDWLLDMADSPTMEGQLVAFRETVVSKGAKPSTNSVKAPTRPHELVSTVEGEIRNGRNDQQAQRKTKAREVLKMKVDGKSLSGAEQDAISGELEATLETKIAAQSLEFDRIEAALKAVRLNGDEGAVQKLSGEARQARRLMDEIPIKDFERAIRDLRDEKTVSIEETKTQPPPLQSPKLKDQHRDQHTHDRQSGIVSGSGSFDGKKLVLEMASSPVEALYARNRKGRIGPGQSVMVDDRKKKFRYVFYQDSTSFLADPLRLVLEVWSERFENLQVPVPHLPGERFRITLNPAQIEEELKQGQLSLQEIQKSLEALFDQRARLEESFRVLDLPVKGLGFLILKGNEARFEFGRFLEVRTRYAPFLRPMEFEESLRQGEVRIPIVNTFYLEVPTVQALEEWWKLADQLKGLEGPYPPMIGAFSGRELKLWRWKLDPHAQGLWQGVERELSRRVAMHDELHRKIGEMADQEEAIDWRDPKMQRQLWSSARLRQTKWAKATFNTLGLPFDEKSPSPEQKELAFFLNKVYERQFNDHQRAPLYRFNDLLNDSLEVVLQWATEYLGKKAMEGFISREWVERVPVEWIPSDQAAPQGKTPRQELLSADEAVRRAEELAQRAAKPPHNLDRNAAQLFAQSWVPQQAAAGQKLRFVDFKAAFLEHEKNKRKDEARSRRKDSLRSDLMGLEGEIRERLASIAASHPQQLFGEDGFRDIQEEIQRRASAELKRIDEENPLYPLYQLGLNKIRGELIEGRVASLTQELLREIQSVVEEALERQELRNEEVIKIVREALSFEIPRDMVEWVRQNLSAAGLEETGGSGSQSRAAQLKKLREELRWTQAHFAAVVSAGVGAPINEKDVSLWETGARHIPGKVLLLARAWEREKRGLRLRILRESHVSSQKEFGVAAGRDKPVFLTQISRYENGRIARVPDSLMERAEQLVLEKKGEGALASAAARADKEWADRYTVDALPAARTRQQIVERLQAHPGGETTLEQLTQWLGVHFALLRRHGYRELVAQENIRRQITEQPVIIIIDFDPLEVASRLLQAVQDDSTVTGPVSFNLQEAGARLQNPNAVVLGRKPELLERVQTALTAAFDGPEPDSQTSPEAHIRWTIAQVLKSRGITMHVMKVEKGRQPVIRAASQQRLDELPLVIPTETDHRPAAIQTILRDVLEERRHPRTVTTKDRAALREVFLNDATYDEAAQNLGIGLLAVRGRVQHGVDVLADWLQPSDVSRKDVMKALQALRTAARQRSLEADDQEWLAAYEAWLANPAQAATHLPPAIHARRALFLQLNLHAPHEELHWTIRPRWDAEYGFLLDVGGTSEQPDHRYLVADRMGRRFQSPGSEHNGGSTLTGYSIGNALLALVAHDRPVDLLVAFHPLQVSVGKVPKDVQDPKNRRPVKRVNLFQNVGHVLGESRLPLPPNYLPATIVPRVAGDDLLQDDPVRRITLHEPGALGGLVTTMYLQQREEAGWTILGVEWADTFNKWEQGSAAKRKGSRDMRAFFQGERGYPPAGQPISVGRASSGYGNIANFAGGELPIPTAYTEPTIIPRAFEADSGKILLGVWAPGADRAHGPPVQMFQFNGKKWPVIHGEVVKRLILTSPFAMEPIASPAPVVPDELLPTLPDAPGPRLEALTTVLRDVLEGHRRPAAVRPNLQVALREVFLNGATYQEAAQTLGISLFAVRGRVSDGMDALARWVNLSGVSREELKACLQVFRVAARRQDHRAGDHDPIVIDETLPGAPDQETPRYVESLDELRKGMWVKRPGEEKEKKWVVVKATGEGPERTVMIARSPGALQKKYVQRDYERATKRLLHTDPPRARRPTPHPRLQVTAPRQGLPEPETLPTEAVHHLGDRSSDAVSPIAGPELPPVVPASGAPDILRGDFQVMIGPSPVVPPQEASPGSQQATAIEKEKRLHVAREALQTLVRYLQEVINRDMVVENRRALLGPARMERIRVTARQQALSKLEARHQEVRDGEKDVKSRRRHGLHLSSRGRDATDHDQGRLGDYTAQAEDTLVSKDALDVAVTLAESDARALERVAAQMTALSLEEIEEVIKEKVTHLVDEHLKKRGMGAKELLRILEESTLLGYKELILVRAQELFAVSLAADYLGAFGIADQAKSAQERLFPQGIAQFVKFHLKDAKAGHFQLLLDSQDELDKVALGAQAVANAFQLGEIDPVKQNFLVSDVLKALNTLQTAGLEEEPKLLDEIGEKALRHVLARVTRERAIRRARVAPHQRERRMMRKGAPASVSRLVAKPSAARPVQPKPPLSRRWGDLVEEIFPLLKSQGFADVKAGDADWIVYVQELEGNLHIDLFKKRSKTPSYIGRLDIRLGKVEPSAAYAYGALLRSGYPLFGKFGEYMADQGLDRWDLDGFFQELRSSRTGWNRIPIHQQALYVRREDDEGKTLQASDLERLIVLVALRYLKDKGVRSLIVNPKGGLRLELVFTSNYTMILGSDWHIYAVSPAISDLSERSLPDSWVSTRSSGLEEKRVILMDPEAGKVDFNGNGRVFSAGAVRELWELGDKVSLEDMGSLASAFAARQIVDPEAQILAAQVLRHLPGQKSAPENYLRLDEESAASLRAVWATVSKFAGSRPIQLEQKHENTVHRALAALRNTAAALAQGYVTNRQARESLAYSLIRLLKPSLKESVPANEMDLNTRDQDRELEEILSETLGSITEAVASEQMQRGEQTTPLLALVLYYHRERLSEDLKQQLVTAAQQGDLIDEGAIGTLRLFIPHFPNSLFWAYLRMARIPGARRLHQWASRHRCEQAPYTLEQFAGLHQIDKARVSVILKLYHIGIRGHTEESRMIKSKDLHRWAAQHRDQTVRISLGTLGARYGDLSDIQALKILRRYGIKTRGYVTGPTSPGAKRLERWAQRREGKEISSSQSELAQSYELSETTVSKILTAHGVLTRGWKHANNKKSNGSNGGHNGTAGLEEGGEFTIEHSSPTAMPLSYIFTKSELGKAKSPGWRTAHVPAKTGDAFLFAPSAYGNYVYTLFKVIAPGEIKVVYKKDLEIDHQQYIVRVKGPWRTPPNTAKTGKFVYPDRRVQIWFSHEDNHLVFVTRKPEGQTLVYMRLFDRGTGSTEARSTEDWRSHPISSLDSEEWLARRPARGDPQKGWRRDLAARFKNVGEVYNWDPRQEGVDGMGDLSISWLQFIFRHKYHVQWPPELPASKEERRREGDPAAPPSPKRWKEWEILRLPRGENDPRAVGRWKAFLVNEGMKTLEDVSRWNPWLDPKPGLKGKAIIWLSSILEKHDVQWPPESPKEETPEAPLDFSESLAPAVAKEYPAVQEVLPPATIPARPARVVESREDFIGRDPWTDWRNFPDKLIKDARVKHPIGEGVVLSNDGKEVVVLIRKKKYTFVLANNPFLEVPAEETTTGLEEEDDSSLPIAIKRLDPDSPQAGWLREALERARRGEFEEGIEDLESHLDREKDLEIQGDLLWGISELHLWNGNTLAAGIGFQSLLSGPYPLSQVDRGLLHGMQGAVLFGVMQHVLEVSRSTGDETTLSLLVDPASMAIEACGKAESILEKETLTSRQAKWKQEITDVRQRVTCLKIQGQRVQWHKENQWEEGKLVGVSYEILPIVLFGVNEEIKLMAIELLRGFLLRDISEHRWTKGEKVQTFTESAIGQLLAEIEKNQTPRGQLEDRVKGSQHLLLSDLYRMQGKEDDSGTHAAYAKRLLPLTGDEVEQVISRAIQQGRVGYDEPPRSSSAGLEEEMQSAYTHSRMP